jgi:hypothetical protein
MDKISFDPDNLELSKKDILEFCDLVLEKWIQKSDKNVHRILAMNAVKTSIIWTDEQSLKSIWQEIIQWVSELLYQNAVSKGTKNDDQWANTEKTKK